MTIYDISEKAGVSIATVSRVLNGSTKVSEKTRQKVLAVMEECDYTPNAFARGLGLNSMNTIGILCTDFRDSYAAKFLYSIEQKLHAGQYDTLIYCTGSDLESRQKYLNLLLSKKVNAIILAGSDFVSETAENNTYISDAAKAVPVMLLGAAMDAPNIYSFIPDDFRSVYEAASSMLSAGIKDILFFYDSATYSNLQKLSGYRAALEDAGISFTPAHVLFCDADDRSIDSMVQSLKNFTKNGIRFNGLIASNDLLAIAALKYANSVKLKVPEDISVIGYGNSLFSVCCTPELTSMDPKTEILCDELISALTEILSGSLQSSSKMLLPGTLIRRRTTLF